MKNLYYILLYILKADVSEIILIPKLLVKNVYFMRYIELKFSKGSPRYIFCT